MVVKCDESDQQFKEACVKYLFNASVQKKRIELTYESRFDTNRVLTHPKRIFFRRQKKKTMYITFEDISKLDTLHKCRKFIKIFADLEPRNPLEEEAVMLLKRRYDQILHSKMKGKKK